MTSNLFEESTGGVILWWEWEYLKEYINKMEGYLQGATKQFEARVNEYKGTKPKQSRGEFMVENVEEYIKYYDEFPYILRNSFFASLYSLLEFDIDLICRKLKIIKEIPINLSDLSGDLLKRLKSYLKLAVVDYPFSGQVWKEINKYSKLRNCIIHNNGLLKKDDKDYKTLIIYIKQKGLLKERYIISGEDVEQEIGLTQKFCEEVVETMQNFIDFTYTKSITQEEQT